MFTLCVASTHVTLLWRHVAAGNAFNALTTHDNGVHCPVSVLLAAQCKPYYSNPWQHMATVTSVHFIYCISLESSRQPAHAPSAKPAAGSGVLLACTYCNHLERHRYAPGVLYITRIVSSAGAHTSAKPAAASGVLLACAYCNYMESTCNAVNSLFL